MNDDSINSFLSNATMLHSLALQVDKRTGRYDIIMVLSEHELDEEKKNVCFANISDLKTFFPAAGWIQVMMLRVKKEGNGFERQYSVRDKEHEAISFRCEDVFIN